MRRPKVDLNQEFIPSSPSPEAQVHNFRPTTPSVLPNHHRAPKEDEEGETLYSSHVRKPKQITEMFWNQRKSEINNITDFKGNHHLPFARIKRIIKSNEDVKMITSETPIIFSKACELFIMDLTLRAWLQTEESKRRTLQRGDIARALRADKFLDFLVHLVPFDHRKDDERESPLEEIGLQSANQLKLPGIDINVVPEFISDNHPEFPQHMFMMKPPFALAEHNYGSTSK